MDGSSNRPLTQCRDCEDVVCGRKVEDDGLQQQLVALQQAVEAAAEQSSPNLEPASKTRQDQP